MEQESPQQTCPTTHWSEVQTVGHGSDQERLAALGRLIQCYQGALLAHLMVKYRLSHDEAADSLQAFSLERILQKDILTKADRQRGKFRTFLLNALDNYYLNQQRNAQTKRRAPPGGCVSMEDLDGFDPVSSGSHPSAKFDCAWSVEVMREATRRMEAECRESGRFDIWGVFKARLLDPLLDDHPCADYAALVAAFGFQSSTQAAQSLTTGKRMFLRVLKGVVAEYAGDEAAVEREIEDLKAILSSRGAWNPPESGK